MRYFLAAAILLLAQAAGSHAQTPVVLQQVVSRHDPALNVAQARLAVGLDGNIYLGSPHASGGYVLRLSPDGRTRSGGKVGYSLTAVAANSSGIVATSEAHFPHRTAFWGKDFSPLGNVADFLVSDKVQWNAPSDVSAGPSGSFYAIDQHRLRIVKMTAPDKVAGIIALDQLGVQSKGATAGLRVDEKNQRFLLAWPGGTVWAVGFDGKPLWSIKTRPAGEPPGAFDVGPDGRLYVLAGGPETVNFWNTDGTPAGAFKLQSDSAGKKPPIHDLRILGNELIVRRADPITLFESYDLVTGKWIRSVRADVEVLTARYPSDVWFAGQAMPLEITFDAGARPTRPRFRVFLRPLGVPEFTELALQDGKVTPPAHARGLYQVRVTPNVRGQVTDYVLDGMVEIRKPDAVGSVSIFTPLNRFYFGTGEEIPVAVVVRGPPNGKSLESITVALKGSEGVVLQEQMKLVHGKGEFTISVKQTASLQPGRYLLDADVPGFTVAPQHLEIGPGLGHRPAFHLVQHGDYELGFPRGPRPLGHLPRLIDLPEIVANHLARSRKLGINLFVDRLGILGNGLGEIGRDEALSQRLGADPLAIAPEKALFEGSIRRTIAGYGAYGIEEQPILLNMDAGLPIGTLWDTRKPELIDAELKKATELLKPYPAFRGWSWAANWWLEKHGAPAAEGAAEAAAYSAALKKAKETGAWAPVLDTVSSRTFGHAVTAEKRFRAIVANIVPGKISAMTGPYRAIEAHPPTLFASADEVDLHYQAEQIQPPQITAHHVDFYKRPGKKAWGHPELWNDDGTGGMIFPTLLQMVMRGADGVGQSGPVGAPLGGHNAHGGDPRNGGAGMTSAYRAIYELLRRYGPLFGTLENADHVAIVVSTRMQRIETWDGKIGSAYFDTLFEAYNACLYAHRPASFVFVEDLKPDSLRRFKAILVAGQRVDLDPPLKAALAQARTDGIAIFHDGTCRPELVSDFTPLGVSFDRVKVDASGWQDDAAYYRFPKYFKDHAAVLRKVLGEIVAPVALCDNPAVMLTERRAGDIRFVWAVNNTMLDWDPGLAWRTTLLMTQRVPVVEKLKLDVPKGYVVRDLFARRDCMLVDGAVTCDLRTMPARLFAILPVGRQLPELGAGPAEDLFGPHVRDVAVSSDGTTALLSTFNWDNNLYGIDLATGAIQWRGKVGHAFAFEPTAQPQGFTVQGFDVLSAEGYHLYSLDARGKVDKRFALFGLPSRATSWASASQIQEPGINSFAVSPDGRWIASAGNLGLVMWDRDGNELWSDAWWRTTRKRVRLLALDDQTIVTLDGATAAARDAKTGNALWSLTLADSGDLGAGTVSGDRKTLVLHADTLGGRLFIVRGGKLINTVVTAAEEVAVSHDGSLVMVTVQRQLKAIDPAGGLLWTYTGDDILHHPRIAPSGERIAVGSELGTLTMIDKAGTVVAERDMQALPLPAWLPNLDLLVATWMGKVTRFDPRLNPRWQVKLTSAERLGNAYRSLAQAPTKDATPTVRKLGWGNALAAPLPLLPNLLAEAKASIDAVYSPRAHGDPRPWQNKIKLLTDGQSEPPPRPWLEWTDIGGIDSGWRGKLTLEIDTFRTQLRVEALTFAEDPSHPESWLRDMRLEWWDAAKEAWQPGPYLLSDAAMHSHVLEKPIEAAKFRLVSSGAASWPVGNIRLGELVLHGKTLGCSHPDVVAKKPIAVLFDENEADLRCLKHPDSPFDFRYSGAFSGGKCLELKKEGFCVPGYHPHFGSTVPNWNFEIAEKPGPGQYRYLRFAWKANSPSTTGMSLLLGRDWPGGGIAISVGDAKWPQGVIFEHRIAGKPPTEWREETIDLWETSQGKPPRILGMGLRAAGGGALFDRIVLSRTLEK